MPFRCCIVDCRSISSKNVGLKFHTFPTNKKRFELWLEKIKEICPRTLKKWIEMNVVPTRIKKFRICSMHFSNSQKFNGFRNRTNLKGNACPDIKIESNNMSICDTMTPTHTRFSQTLNLNMNDGHKSCSSDFIADLPNDENKPSISNGSVHTEIDIL